MGSKCRAVFFALMLGFACSCGVAGTLGNGLPAALKPAGPATMPPLPGNSSDTPAPGAPRIAAFTDNVMLGKDVWQRSANGTTFEGDSLKLTSTTGEIAWGIWRWPNFIDGVKPQTIELNVTPGGGGTCWLLLGDYTARRWEVHGPLDGSITTFTYDQSKSYISNNSKAVFAALVTEGGATLQVDALTVAATDLPAPDNLVSTDVRETTAHLSWNAITVPVALGYQIYTGPNPDFNIGDPGVVLRGPTMITGNSYTVTRLPSGTHYYWRVRAYFGAWGPLSPTAEFTTRTTLPPVPVITMELPVQQNMVMALDSYETTDPDTPLDEIVFSWDFDNDGTIDAETTGPQTVFHAFEQRGPVTIKLTAFDGQNVSVTKDTEVSFRYRYEATTIPEGANQSVVACDTDPESGRVVLMKANTNALYYDGSSWQTIPLAFAGYTEFFDVALTPTSIATLCGTVHGGETPYYDWAVMEYSAGSWTELASGSRSGNTLLAGSLDVSPGGRVSTAMITTSVTEFGYTGALYITHEKTDGSTSSNSVVADSNKVQPVKVLRSDDSTQVVYCKSNMTHVWSFDDGGNSDTQYQIYTGDAGSIAAGMDPEDTTHVFWATGNGADKIYYGDNYGDANDVSQFIDGGDSSISVAAVGLAGDNEVHVFWTAQDTDETEHLSGFDSVAGGGQAYEIIHGLGAASASLGTFYPSSSDTEVYVVVHESRDGESIARVIRDGSVQSTIQVAPPSDSGELSDAAAAISFEDNSFLCLATEGFPTCLTTRADSPDGIMTAGMVGQDTFCQANCAAAIPGGGFMVGSYTGLGNLQLNRFALGNPVGTETAYLAGTSKARLVTNRDISELRLFYLTGSAQRIEECLWTGSGWSAPNVAYSGTSAIQAFSVALTADNGEWGVAFIDSFNNVWLVETTGGTWGTAQQLSTDPVYGTCGIGLDYCLADADQGLVVVVERQGAAGGVFAGIRPAGGPITWEKLDSAGRTEVQSLSAFWHMDFPLVVYHHQAYPFNASRLRFYEKVPSGWFLTEPPIELHSEPLAKAVLPAGHILFAGYEDSHYPRQMVVAEFYP